jgi:hypothetical protein
LPPRKLAVCFMLIVRSISSSTLNTELLRSSETSVNFHQTT